MPKGIMSINELNEMLWRLRKDALMPLKGYYINVRGIGIVNPTHGEAVETLIKKGYIPKGRVHLP